MKEYLIMNENLINENPIMNENLIINEIPIMNKNPITNENPITKESTWRSIQSQSRITYILEIPEIPQGLPKAGFPTSTSVNGDLLLLFWFVTLHYK